MGGGGGLWCLMSLSKETGVPLENHRPATSYWQILLYNVVLLSLIRHGLHSHYVLLIFFQIMSSVYISIDKRYGMGLFVYNSW